MAGKFDSEPWQGEDWSGKGREVYYVDLDVDTLVDSDKTAFITTAQLTEAIPEFDWTGGHSGRVLSPEASLKLEKMWYQYLYSNQGIFDDKVAYTSACWNEDMLDGMLEENLCATKDNTCEICGYNYQKLFGDDCGEKNSYWMFWPDNKATGLTDDFTKHIHCVCGNCNTVDVHILRKRLGEPEREQDGLSDKKDLPIVE